MACRATQVGADLVFGTPIKTPIRIHGVPAGATARLISHPSDFMAAEVTLANGTRERWIVRQVNQNEVALSLLQDREVPCGDVLAKVLDIWCLPVKLLWFLAFPVRRIARFFYEDWLNYREELESYHHHDNCNPKKAATHSSDHEGVGENIEGKSGKAA